MLRFPILFFAAAIWMTAQPAVETQFKQTAQLIAAHRSAVPRLAAIAESTAQVLAKGGAFFVCCGENAWINEAESRAGGPIGLKVARTATQVTENSVVWVSYNASSYKNMRAEAARMPRSALVVMFGPKPEEGTADTRWLDSLTAWDADPNQTLMGNVLSLWSLTGEVAAATARIDRTLAFFQSAWVPGGNDRNHRYEGQVFHKHAPKMQPSDPGVLANAYFDALETMTAGIAETELPKIRAVGRTIAARRAAGKPVSLVVTSHLLSGLAPGSPMFQFESDPAKLATRLSKNDYVVSIGYSALDADLFRAVHRAGAGATWALATSGKPPGIPTESDTFLNEYWEPGDAAVTVWGYDVPILPPSGVAQLFIYQLLQAAAADSPAPL